jgi:hypothetical protein
MEDNLLKKNDSITHHREAVADDEEVTLENSIVSRELFCVNMVMTSS